MTNHNHHQSNSYDHERDTHGQKIHILRLIAPPSGGALSQLIQNAKEDSVFGKLYRNNMDGLKSFFTKRDGLEHLVNTEKTAFIQNGVVINSYTEYHCKVCCLHIGGLRSSFKFCPLALV